MELEKNVKNEIISGKRAVGRPRLQYLKLVARNTGADGEKMASKNSRWKEPTIKMLKDKTKKKKKKKKEEEEEE